MKENSSAQPPHRLTMLGFGMYKVVHGTGTELVSKGYPKKAKHRAAMEADLLGRLKVLSVSERSGHPEEPELCRPGSRFRVCERVASLHRGLAPAPAASAPQGSGWVVGGLELIRELMAVARPPAAPTTAHP